MASASARRTKARALGFAAPVHALITGHADERDRRVALVTSAFHMPRALAIARSAGLDASAFPADYYALPSARAPWENWLPTLGALSESTIALHEILAIAFDRRSGRTAR